MKDKLDLQMTKLNMLLSLHNNLENHINKYCNGLSVTIEDTNFVLVTYNVSTCNNSSFLCRERYVETRFFIGDVPELYNIVSHFDDAIGMLIQHKEDVATVIKTNFENKSLYNTSTCQVSTIYSVIVSYVEIYFYVCIAGSEYCYVSLSDIKKGLWSFYEPRNISNL